MLPHRSVYIVLLEQIAVFSPLIYTQPFVMGCGAAVKYCALFPFESRYENPMSCAFNINGETMLHGYDRIIFFFFELMIKLLSHMFLSGILPSCSCCLHEIHLPQFLCCKLCKEAIVVDSGCFFFT